MINMGNDTHVPDVDLLVHQQTDLVDGAANKRHNKPRTSSKYSQYKKIMTNANKWWGQLCLTGHEARWEEEIYRTLRGTFSGHECVFLHSLKLQEHFTEAKICDTNVFSIANTWEINTVSGNHNPNIIVTDLFGKGSCVVGRTHNLHNTYTWSATKGSLTSNVYHLSRSES